MADLAFGQLQSENQNVGITCVTQSVYYLYPFKAAGVSNKMTVDQPQSRLTAQEAGNYYVVVAGNAQSNPAGGSTDDFQWELHKNAGRTFLPTRFDFNTNVANLPFALVGIINLAIGDYIDLRVRCTTAAGVIVRGRDMVMAAVKISP